MCTYLEIENLPDKGHKGLKEYVIAVVCKIIAHLGTECAI